MWRTKRQRLRGIREGYRSGLEESIAKQLQNRKDLSWTYEKERIKYIPEPKHYTPDFILEGKIYGSYLQIPDKNFIKDQRQLMQTGVRSMGFFMLKGLYLKHG